jgi:hypothetical protein
LLLLLLLVLLTFAACSLCFYTAASRNTALMQHLLTHKTRHMDTFPSGLFSPSPGAVAADMAAVCPSTDLACCCAALKAGDAHMLRLLFSACSITRSSDSSWQRRFMLQYAARHSNAACIREAVHAIQLHVPLLNRPVRRAAAAVVMPQHLQMAATRTDPWAAGAQCFDFVFHVF